MQETGGTGAGERSPAVFHGLTGYPVVSKLQEIDRICLTAVAFRTADKHYLTLRGARGRLRLRSSRHPCIPSPSSYYLVAILSHPVRAASCCAGAAQSGPRYKLILRLQSGRIGFSAGCAGSRRRATNLQIVTLIIQRTFCGGDGTFLRWMAPYGYAEGKMCLGSKIC